MIHQRMSSGASKSHETRTPGSILLPSNIRCIVCADDCSCPLFEPFRKVQRLNEVTKYVEPLFLWGYHCRRQMK